MCCVSYETNLPCTSILCVSSVPPIRRSSSEVAIMHWCALSRNHRQLYIRYIESTKLEAEVRGARGFPVQLAQLYIHFVFPNSASGAMHSGDMAELGGVNLTDAEREALLEVMQRAKVCGQVTHVYM